MRYTVAIPNRYDHKYDEKSCNSKILVALCKK